MRSFEEWFASGGTRPEPPKAEVVLPDGVWDDVTRPGKYFARCRHCDEVYELCHDVSEFTEEGNYCGAGGPSPCIL